MRYNIDISNLTDQEILKLLAFGVIKENSYIKDSYYVESLNCLNLGAILNKDIIINYNHNTHKYSISIAEN